MSKIVSMLQKFDEILAGRSPMKTRPVTFERRVSATTRSTRISPGLLLVLAMSLSGPLLFSFAKTDHVHYSAHEEEREPHEEGIPSSRQGHDETRRGTEPSDAQ